jgi:hypothetical protein
MARYFFTVEDGQARTDAEGTELPNLQAAQHDAVQILSDVLRNNAEAFWGAPTFGVVVRDGTGSILFTLDLRATMAPAVDRGGVRSGESSGSS